MTPAQWNEYQRQADVIDEAKKWKEEQNQTAVSWIIEQLQAPCRGIPSHIIEQAKEMEKQQIVDACKKFGYLNGADVEDYEEYYNETYGSKGSDEYPEIEGTMAICNDIISSQTEISDEDIEEASKQINYGGGSMGWIKDAFKKGAKWYREQLKKK